MFNQFKKLVNYGSIGSVNLTFRKELARFENYTPLHTSEIEGEAFSEFPQN